MEAISYIRYLRSSPRKLREWAKVLHGLSPQVAISRLTLKSDKAGRLLILAVKSAMANATNNKKAVEANLRIKTIEIGKGPMFKRWQPVSRGMAHSIKKRTSHIKVVLEEKNGA